MGERFDVLIVGAGHGGAHCAVALRQAGFVGSIAIIGAEAELPYQRPPLSKEYFAGERTREQILLRPAAFWAERDVTLLPGRTVTSVDATNKRIATDSGESYAYGALVWATGGAARTLPVPGGDFANVQGVRTLADADRLIAAAQHGTRFAVIGGGYIGLEAAAVLAKAGKQVTVLEAMPRVLARVAGEPLSRFYEGEHRAHGVDVRLGVTVTAIEGAGGCADTVVLADGERIPVDHVIVGIGIVPAVDPLLVAGAQGAAGGVLVDAGCQTSLADVYAIGDCAAHANAYADGAVIRLESVQNANDMASAVAKRLTGVDTSYDAAPWFWSNQYDLKLQTVGLSIGHDAVVVRGDVDARSFSLVYLKGGRVIALDCVNAMKDYVQGKALVTGGAVIDPALLADAGVAIKDMLAGA